MIHLSYSMLVALVIAVAVAAFWYDGTRAREAANRIAADACRRRSLQLLDGTVALALPVAALAAELTIAAEFTEEALQRMVFGQIVEARHAFEVEPDPDRAWV